MPAQKRKSVSLKMNIEGKSGNPASSVAKPAMPSGNPTSSAAKPAVPKRSAWSGASKPAISHVIIAFYNITWENGKLLGKDSKRHEKTLADDIHAALHEYNVDLLFLSECGEIEEGLLEDLWLPLVRRLAGPGFVVTHQSHYTSIVRLNTVHIRQGPELLGPMSTWPGHEYRKCQRLCIEFKDSADEPIWVFNVHSPSSKKRPLISTVRKQILEWFLGNVGDRAIIGGDLNSNSMALDSVLGYDPGIFYLSEPDALHGDIIIAKGVQAESMACNVSSTSKGHQMCMATVQLQSDSADKPAAMASKTGDYCQRRCVALEAAGDSYGYS